MDVESEFAGALRTASAAAEQTGRLAVTADLAGPVGEALQDVRETGCASTAAAHPYLGYWPAAQ